MMGVKSFRSEEEQLLSLLDEQQGSYPFLTHEDPVIFHNREYERDLLMEYNLDFGGESTSSHQTDHHDEQDDDTFSLTEPKLEQPWFMSPSESEDPSEIQEHHSKPAVKLTKAQQRFNPYSSGPLIKEAPSNSRSRGFSQMYRSESPKRGRPAKTTSTSKMANYARNYREQKKNELSMTTLRNQELEAENKLLREENNKMKAAMARASEEIARLKKVIDQDSQIARVVANMGQSASYQDFGARAGVCVHVGSLGTTVEVCKQCADANQQRLDSKINDFDLFNGDFTAFDAYLNGTASC